MAVLLTAGALVFHARYREERRKDVEVLLRSTLEIKLDQLLRWREDRVNGVLSLLDSPVLPRYLARLAADAGDREASALVSRRLSSFIRLNQYPFAAVAEISGKVIVYAGDKPERDCPRFKPLIARALASGRPEIGDFYLREGEPAPHIDIAAPAYGPGGKRLMLLLRVDPADFLYPLLQSWSAKGETGELLLAARDGGDVLFLNDLRHVRNAALRLRRPLSTQNLPSALALKGGTGVIMAPDYRGVPVLAAYAPVPGTNWGMVVKMDLAEVMVGVAAVRVLLLLLVLSLTAAAGAGAYLLFLRQAEAYERAYAEVRANYELLAEKANDCILVVDMERRRVLEANPKACETYGYTLEEMKALPVEAVVPEKDRGAFAERIAENIRAGSRIYEATHRRKNGETFPVEISSSIVDGPAGRQMFVIVRDISERRRAEADIRERDAVFGQFMEHSPVYVFFKDENIRSMHLSRNYETMLGRPLGELLGKNMFELFPGELARKMVEDDKRILREGREEVTVEELNGRKYRTIKFPIDLPGKPRCLAGYTIDITEQESFKERLARVNERLTLAARAGRLGVWDWDIKADVLMWDDGMYELYGVRKEDFKGAYEAWAKTMHPDDKDRCEKELRAALQGGSRYESEFRVRLPGGEVRYIRAEGDIFRGPDGTPLRMVGVNQDITAGKLAELKLRENEERLRVTLEETHIGTWDWDVGHDVWSASPTYFTMLGYEPLSGPSDRAVWLERVHPEDREMVEARIREVLAGGKGKYQYEARMRHADGSYRWHAVLGTTVEHRPDGKPARLMGVRMDVTERRRNEEINFARARLLQYASSHSLDDLLEESLNEAEKLTGSSIGFYHFVNEDQKSLTLQNWSTATKSRFCKAEGKGLHYDMAKAGVWVDCFYRREPVIHNDYASLPHRKGLPGGHAEVRRELVVPVLRGGMVTAMLGVGNKETDYVQEDVRAVSLLADLAWEIAERKMAEEALRQSSLLMQSTQALARIGGWEWDLKKRTMHWTDEMYRLHGLAPDAVKGDSEAHIAESQKCYRPEDLPAVMAAFNKCVETGEPYDLEFPFKSFDGRSMWVRTTARAERKDGMVTRVLGTLADITERKLAEEALRESERSVRRKLDAILSPDMDVSRLELSDIIDGPRIQKLMDRFYAVTKIGIGIIDLKGKVLVGTGWQEICTRFHRATPATCRLCKESDLELSRGVPAGETKLYQCKNHMWDMVTPIMLGDVHVGNIFLGQFLFEGEEPDLQTFREQARRYGFEENEYLAALKAVPRWSRATVDAAMAFYASFADVIGQLSLSNVKLASTLEERNRAQEALQKAAKALREKNQEMENFLYITTHDLRSPLVNIQGFSQNMARYVKRLQEELPGAQAAPEIRDLAAKKIPEALDFVLGSARRMDALITALLKVSRAGRVEMRPETLDAAALLGKVLDAMRFQLEQAGAEVSAGPLPPCRADAGALSQVFGNLLDNAVKYRDEDRRLKVEISGEVNGGVVVYRIADNGPGIPEKDLDRIWNVFYSQQRADPRKGEGIGLPMVKRLVEKNGGTIRAEAKEGQGTAFTVELPGTGEAK